jgi:hypothetical protein
MPPVGEKSSGAVAGLPEAGHRQQGQYVEAVVLAFLVEDDDIRGPRWKHYVIAMRDRILIAISHFEHERKIALDSGFDLGAVHGFSARDNSVSQR